jgi:hypothetical protein
MSSEGPYGRQGYQANPSGYGGNTGGSYGAPTGGYMAPQYGAGGQGGGGYGGSSYSAPPPEPASYGGDFGAYSSQISQVGGLVMNDICMHLAVPPGTVTALCGIGSPSNRVLVILTEPFSFFLVRYTG